MKIIQRDDKVIINGNEFYGHIDKKQRCSSCKLNLVYYEEFDAYFCPKCNEWKESQCTDHDCRYCSKRPLRPLSL